MLAARLTTILGLVAALVARRFLQMPALSPHTRTLWGWLQRRIQRCGRLCARVQAGRVRVSRPKPAGTPARTGVRVRMPQGRGWLVQALGHEAAAYASQLHALLAEPGVTELLAEVPALARLLAPIRRMLGVGMAAARTAPVTSRRALAAAGASLLLPLPHQFAWPRGPDGAA